MNMSFALGNPAYQLERVNTSDKPVYNEFMDAAFNIAEKVEMITPARFLFNAGKTPKDWNKKMLNDEHFKVLEYEPSSKNVFPNTDIKGGVCVTYRDKSKIFEPIETFSPFPKLNAIRKKVESKNQDSLSTIMTGQNAYKFSKKLHIEHPEVKALLSKGHQHDITSNSFEKLPDIFTEEKNGEVLQYKFMGLLNGKRVWRFINQEYVVPDSDITYYKVLFPCHNGSGALGEVLSTPLIGTPLIGYTQTFIAVGKFNTEQEAENCMKYVKSKFSRVMLGILKVTQNIARETYKYVPLQDFTTSSDIDWSVSIAEIDQQLYKKYNLSSEEIKFIETHVKEMV